MNRKTDEKSDRTLLKLFKRYLRSEKDPAGEEITLSPEETGSAAVPRGIAGTAKALFPLFATALFSFAVSSSSVALGATPIGPALLSAAPSFASATAVLAGTLFSALRLGKAAIPFIFVSIGIFSFRLALGALGTVKTKALGNCRDLLFGSSAKLPRLAGDLRFVKLNSSFNTAPYVRILVALAAALLLGLSNLLAGSNLWYDVFGTVLGAVVTPLLCCAYSALTDSSANPALRKAGLGALLFALVLALKDVSVAGISLALAAGFSASLAAGYSLGVADGALIAVFAGFGADPELFGAFPLAAMCAGAVGVYSSGVAAVVATLLGMSWALFSSGILAISAALPEFLLSAALFYPAARLGIVQRDRSLFENPAAIPSVPGGGRTVCERMMLLARAMKSLSRVFSNLSARLSKPDRSEIYYLCEDAFYGYCTVCPKMNICHARESFSDGEVIRRAAAALFEDGTLDVSSFPRTVVRGCPSIDGVIGRINASYRELLRSAVREDGTADAAAHYADVSKMISECVKSSGVECERNSKLSERLASRFSDEGITYETLSVYGSRRPQVYVRGFTVKDLACGAEDLRKIAEEAVGAPLTEPEMTIDYDKLNMFCECRRRCDVLHGEFSSEGVAGVANGDRIASFKTSDGDFCLLICDGMGSGGDAALTAKVSALFLEKIVGAGCDIPTSLEMLNDFARKRRLECSSTVDLLKVDPYCGEAVFYKCGAAPSFVLRGDRVFRIECEGSPLGILDRIVAKSVNFRLAPGDRIVMASDGVIPDDGDSAWFYDLLTGGDLPKKALPDAAKAVALAAKQRSRRPDDATVGIVRIDAA